MSEIEKIDDDMTIPMIPMRGLVLFPGAVVHFDVGRDKSVLALKAAMDADRKVFVIAQRDMKQESPTLKDMYKVGVVGTIKQLLKAEKNSIRVLIEGGYKAKLVDIIKDKPFYLADIKRIKSPTKSRTSIEETEALVRLVKILYEEYCEALPNVPKEMLMQIRGEDDINKIFEGIVANILISCDLKQELLEMNNIAVAMQRLAEILEHETDVLEIEQNIYRKVTNSMVQNQREYYLREQMKAIEGELNDYDDEDDADNFAAKIMSIKNMSQDTKDKLMREEDRMRKSPSQSQEYNVIRSYLELCLSLPFDEQSKEKLDIQKAQKQLDADHFGLAKVKERIVELLAVRQLKPDVKGQIICLVGPPGVGKTSIAASVAKTLNRKYVRISLGGVRDESDIRGHRKTYVGAMPGRIIEALRQAKTNNPLILLDEIDKMGNDFRGDPASAMLEVLDSEQNSTFVDHYVEIPFDLSHVLFITTANTTSTIPSPLLDRMEIIELPSYTREEKFNIAKKHLVRKQLAQHGLNAKMLSFKDDAIYDIIDCYTREAGVRKLERTIGAVCRKTAKLIVSGEKPKVTASCDNIEELLLPRRYPKTKPVAEDKVGIVNGLAWTSVGGEMLQIEAAVMSGTGKIQLTGSLGDVMKESAEIAISYVRTIADAYSIKPDFYKTCDIHIHAPEGAVPKDGPSAGVTMVTALVSALTQRPVRGDIAMTGEISLRGRVMPIGGLKEKSMAAYREEKKLVIIPLENKPDLYEVDEVVKNNVKFVPVSAITDVLEIALLKKPIAIDENPNMNWCTEIPTVEPSALRKDIYINEI